MIEYQSLCHMKWNCKYHWARGFFVSTVGLDEDMERNYIREQETENERYEQMTLWKS